MISYEEALKIILEHSAPLGQQRLRLENLLGAYLARPVLATLEMPRFDNSAVDGFGVQIGDIQEAASDNPVKLSLVGTIRAGDAGNLKLTPGHAIKILTGAPVPKDVEAVVMKEFCEEQENQVLIHQLVDLGENIRRRGEEFRKGSLVLSSGIRVTPPVIGLLATFGYKSFWAYRRPKVALVITGSELVQPGKPLKPGQIYNSNAYALKAAVQEMGILDCQVFEAKDEREATLKQLKKALQMADVVIPVGGISVGAYDFVKEVLTALGVETHFWKVALKPGKPVYFGSWGASGKRKKLVFGLPGNPVSALVTFHQLVRPALLKMMGSPETFLAKIQAKLTTPLRKKAGRLEWVRGIATLENGRFKVCPTKGQDSHMLGGLSKANCLICFPEAEESLSEGEGVSVDFLQWPLS